MKKKNIIKILLTVIAIAIIPTIYFGSRYYKLLYKNNVIAGSGSACYIYVPTGSTFETLVDSLVAKKALLNIDMFKKAARLKNFSKVRPGRYCLKNGMNNSRLIHMFAIGEQAPVRLTLAGNIRTKEKLASVVSSYIEPDSLMLLACFNDNRFLNEYGLNSDNVIGICMLNTYEFYWNTSPEKFVERMVKESYRFWNSKRESKREQTSWSRMQIATLASIVAEETLKPDEMPRVAGVYINRLSKGMLLQADPTVKFAVGDFSLRRVLDRHTSYNSPYNTYLYAGLPPGPICIPSATAIDAVLNAETHDYYYFCAKADFSGYHSFAKTLAQHNQNARSYRDALNRNKIYR